MGKVVETDQQIGLLVEKGKKVGGGGDNAIENDHV